MFQVPFMIVSSCCYGEEESQGLNHQIIQKALLLQLGTKH